MSHNVKIILDPPYTRGNPKGHQFSPGDTVSGKIVLTIAKQVSIDAIPVTFSGQCAICIGRTDFLPDFQRTMFEFSTEVFRDQAPEGTILQPGTYGYPFSFTFPGESHYPFHDFEYDNYFPFQGMNTLGRRIVPPSLAANGSGTAEILYKVQAKVKRPKLLSSSIDDEIPLCFRPFRKEATIAPLPK